MKIIFLDIDGVLNVNPTERDQWGAIFKIHLVNHLRRIIEATGAKIVISSTWKDSGLKELQRMWKERDLPGEVIAVTPYSNTRYVKFARDFDEQNIEEILESPRGAEIDWTLQFYPSDTKYVIIDDCVAGMLYGQRNNIIHTPVGLTEELANKAIEILLCK